eukprot:SM000162S02395  [mRNA]  locus=s162:244011:248305:- [translate_table: standard]
MAAAPAFPFASASAAPAPTALWGAGLAPPLPTNAPWQNLVLNAGQAPEVVHPYLASCRPGGLAFGFPQRQASAAAVLQAFVATWVVGTVEGLAARTVAAYDDLGVTVSWTPAVGAAADGSGAAMTAYLVRGSPYVTLVFHGTTPVVKTENAIMGLSADASLGKHTLVLNNGETWLLYTSSANMMLVRDGDTLTAAQPFTGVLRFALLPEGSAAALLDQHRRTYPTGGTASIPGLAQVQYRWATAAWGGGLSSALLMLSLPLHRAVLARPSPSATCSIVPKVTQVNLWYESIDGIMYGEIGNVWLLVDQPVKASWHSLRGVPNPSRRSILAALQKDVAELSTITDPATYFAGKALARVARLVLIAEELGDFVSMATARNFLKTNLSPWLQAGGHNSNGFVYDPRWGGVVSQQGAADQGADFGLGVYNDHHYHYGYFLYASAVLAKLDSAWARANKAAVYTLVRDICSQKNDTYFPRIRHFDFFVLHSWASGLVEFMDGRNQESTSEAVNAYYAVSLVGMAYGDLTLLNLGLTLTGFESRAAQAYWHIPDNSTLYDAVYTQANRVTGVLWANKRDSGLWFASSDNHDIRLGIQAIPISPITERLFSDKAYTKQLVSWSLASEGPETSDGWKGFVYALQAIDNKSIALNNIQPLQARL